VVSVDASIRCIDVTARYGVAAANVNHRVCDSWRVRWVRRLLVVLLLAAPVVVVTVVAWPSGSSGGGGGGARADGSGPDGALVAGDTVEGEVGFGEVAEYRLVGDGRVRINVRGDQPFDATLTVRTDDGEEVAYNDDTNGLDPEVVVDAGEEPLIVEVRELGSNAGSYTLSVE
jgi:hypothetical protein